MVFYRGGFLFVFYRCREGDVVIFGGVFYRIEGSRCCVYFLVREGSVGDLGIWGLVFWRRGRGCNIGRFGCVNLDKIRYLFEFGFFFSDFIG